VLGRTKPRGEDPIPELDLRQTDLQGAHLLGDLRGIRLYKADLREARVQKADLQEADLQGADLKEADLQGANLRIAFLEGANLLEANVTEDQLADTRSLQGAIMPNGQILKSDDNPDGTTFEEWLKSQDRKEDEENE
jgi:uncharacterized protein YjbI with pentapeptide repeats